MKPFILVTAAVLFSGAAHAADLPGDAASGKKLHAARCAGCHDDKVYTRQNRRITSLEALIKQINACAHMPDVTLGKSQVEDVVKYLNESFYKFK